MADLGHQLAGLCGRADDVGLFLAQRLDAQVHTALFRQGQTALEGFPGPPPGLLKIPVLLDVALLGGADDHHLASQIAAEVDQRLEIGAGPLPDSRIDVVDVEAFRADQQPVQADDFHAGLLGGPADFPSPAGRNILYRGSQGEGGDFDALVPDFSGVVEDLFDGPVFEVLVAGAEFHAFLLSQSCSQDELNKILHTLWNSRFLSAKPGARFLLRPDPDRPAAPDGRRF